MSDLQLVLLMALVTFIPRYLPFALANRIQLPRLIEQALS
jgi:branched-subunit amino acid transport protein